MKYERIFKYAMQMELDGSNFFKKNAEKFKNPATKDLFEKLSKIEMEHYDYLKNQLDSYSGKRKFDLSEDIFGREENIFESREEGEKIDYTLVESDVPEITILRMAYLIERDFKEFYMEIAENIEDENFKKIFKKLSNWESGHEELFKREYKKAMKEYMNLPWGG